MRTPLRILAIAGALAAVLLIALAVAVATIDVNAFAGALRQRVRDATGRDLAIGAIALERSLAPKLIVEDVALANAPWGQAAPLLVAKRLEVQVALLPLLQRRLELVRFALIEPVIALETDASGRGNWAFDHAPGAAASAAMPTYAGPALGALSAGDVDITKGTLTYRDGATGKTSTIAIDALAMATRGPQADLNVDFHGKVGAIALDLKGDLGPLDALRQRRWPYPVAVQGEINGRKVSFATKLTVADGAYRCDDLALAFGPNAVKGDLTVTPGGPRPKLAFKLAAAALSVADLPAPLAEAPAAKPAVTVAGHAPPHVFADEPVSFAPLRSVDADGDLTIDQLTLRNGRRIDHVHARIALHDGHAEVSDLEAAAFGGSARLHLTLDASREGQERIALRLDAKGLDLAALLAAVGAPRDVRGGKTDLTLDLVLHGTSPRQWASTVNGTALAIVGPATLANSKSDTAPAFNRLAEAVNPFRSVDATTEVQCAVIRLPLTNGVARVDRSIAMETKKIGVLASGTLDFRDETLDLSFKPKARAGIPIDLVQFADLVRLRGPFNAPAIAIDAKGSAATAARLGAAYASGGLSLLGEALLARAGGGGGECEVALGRAPAPAASAPASTPEHTKPTIDDLAKSLGRLLHR